MLLMMLPGTKSKYSRGSNHASAAIFAIWFCGSDPLQRTMLVSAWATRLVAGAGAFLYFSVTTL